MMTTIQLRALPLVAGFLVAACAAPGPAAPSAATSASATVTASAGPASSPAPAATPSTSPPAVPAATAGPSPAAGRNPAAYVEGAPYAVEVDPADFGAVVDNVFLPLVPGTVLVYKGGDERVVITVLEETREILGVATTVVHDQAFVNGELAEDTFDWYAQDRAGNVWYFGEATEELENGKVTSTAGSWEAGVDGALPGVVMLADPRVGDAYRQEYLQGEAEDVARVFELGGSIEVAAGTFTDTLVTEDWTPLEPSVVEHKTYARGVGVVHELRVKGGHEELELVRIRTR